MSVRDREVILKMIKYCNDVGQLMEKYNSDFEAYKTDIPDLLNKLDIILNK
jgi:hypothetical protein